MTWLLVSVTSSDMEKDFNFTQNLTPGTGNIFLHICAKLETAQCVCSVGSVKNSISVTNPG